MQFGAIESVAYTLQTKTRSNKEAEFGDLFAIGVVSSHLHVCMYGGFESY